MKICLLTIATNKYIKFAKPLFESVSKYFLPDHEVSVALFSNHPAGTVKLDGDIKLPVLEFDQEHIPWPGTTLMRYHVFLKQKEFLLKNFDYVFYSDIDMLFVDKVGDEVLGNLVATAHPGFYDKPRAAYTYETRPVSKAYIAPHEGFMYFAGGFQGGKTSVWLQAAETIAKNIQTDLDNGLVAVWHDESHWNRYLVNNMPSKVLSPSYCYPESWNLPFPKRLLALDKNHAEMRKEQ